MNYTSDRIEFDRVHKGGVLGVTVRLCDRHLVFLNTWGQIRTPKITSKNNKIRNIIIQQSQHTPSRTDNAPMPGFDETTLRDALARIGTALQLLISSSAECSTSSSSSFSSSSSSNPET